MPERENSSSDGLETTHGEAIEFNKMVDEGNISTEYASNLPKEQSPELTREIIRNAERHIRDVNAFGELAHGARGVSKEDFVDIVQNGFKTLADKYGGVDKVPQDFRFTSLYPDMVSFGMNGVGKMFKGDEGLIHNDASQYGIRIPDKWEREDYGKAQHNYEVVPMTFIANPKYINDSMKHIGDLPKDEQQIPVAFVGDQFDSWGFESAEEVVKDEFFSKLLGYCKRIGWFSASKADNELEYLRFFARTNYDAYYGEVVVSNKYQRFSEEPMTDGIVINPSYSKQTIEWMNDFIVEHPEKAIPVYDIYGNLLWPVKISNQEIKKRTEVRLEGSNENPVS